MHIPLRPFCLKLAEGIAERNTKDHTRFPHPQAALEHFDDIEDLGVGTPRKIGFCSLKQRWSYPHFDAMSQSRQVSWLQANVTHSEGNLIGFNRGMYKTSLGFEHHDLDVRLISWMSLVILSQTRNFIVSYEWLCTPNSIHCQGQPWKLRPTLERIFAMYNVQRTEVPHCDELPQGANGERNYLSFLVLLSYSFSQRSWQRKFEIQNHPFRSSISFCNCPSGFQLQLPVRWEIYKGWLVRSIREATCMVLVGSSYSRCKAENCKAENRNVTAQLAFKKRSLT